MGKLLITFGLILISAGFIIHLFWDKLNWFGNLIGNFSYNGDKMRIYFPFTSMLIVSIVITLIHNIFSRIFK